MSEEIKFLYMWIYYHKATIKFLKNWVAENPVGEGIIIGIPGRKMWHNCSSDKIKDVVGVS